MLEALRFLLVPGSSTHEEGRREDPVITVAT